MRTGERMIGADARTAALAAAGACFQYGRKRPHHLQPIAGWALRLKGEVLEKMENASELDREIYDRLVDDAAARYARAGRVSASELKDLTADLKAAWTQIGEQIR